MHNRRKVTSSICINSTNIIPKWYCSAVYTHTSIKHHNDAGLNNQKDTTNIYATRTHIQLRPRSLCSIQTTITTASEFIKMPKQHQIILGVVCRQLPSLILYRMHFTLVIHLYQHHSLSLLLPFSGLYLVVVQTVSVCVSICREFVTIVNKE